MNWIGDESSLNSQFSPETDLWINSLIMLSSDITTWKPGNDFDWLIILFLHNYA